MLHDSDFRAALPIFGYLLAKSGRSEYSVVTSLEDDSILAGGDQIQGKPNVIDFYQNHYDEQGRLLRNKSALEFARTQDIILRYLPKPPASVLDVGGGPGRYSAWLAELGYSVKLLDIVPKHIEQARALSDSLAGKRFEAQIGDATNLEVEDNSQDAVLELGPLYHLIEKRQRTAALSAAHRVLKSGGWLVVAAITRYASVLSGLLEDLLEDAEFKPVFERDLVDGQHLPHSTRDFTTAHFHHPEELKAEVKEAGFRFENLLAVEGPLWLLEDLGERWVDTSRRAQLLHALNRIEAEPSLLGASLHFLCIGQKLGSSHKLERLARFPKS
jgi:ubiquinone/menaquinone biosynthesis C-methylase UbiE